MERFELLLMWRLPIGNLVSLSKPTYSFKSFRLNTSHIFVYVFYFDILFFFFFQAVLEKRHHLGCGLAFCNEARQVIYKIYKPTIGISIVMVFLAATNIATVFSLFRFNGMGENCKL